MDMFQQLLGGGGRQQQYGDFIQRYQQGAPWDGISDEEALDRYREVRGHMSPELYQDSATEAFGRLSPDQRLELGRYVQGRARHQGIAIPDFDQDGIDDRLQDPRELAMMTGRLEQRQPGIVEQLLGGGGGFGAGSFGGGSGFGPLGGGSMGGGGGLLSNPIAKAALAGIAATAAQRMMSGR